MAYTRQNHRFGRLGSNAHGCTPSTFRFLVVNARAGILIFNMTRTVAAAAEGFRGSVAVRVTHVHTLHGPCLAYFSVHFNVHYNVRVRVYPFQTHSNPIYDYVSAGLLLLHVLLFGVRFSYKLFKLISSAFRRLTVLILR
jgi:hypothetical protein